MLYQQCMRLVESGGAEPLQIQRATVPSCYLFYFETQSWGGAASHFRCSGSYKYCVTFACHKANWKLCLRGS